jgi:hypothetical protein
MDANRLVRSKPLRLVVALAYATLFVWIMPRTAYVMPVLLIALGLPLIFRLVPRNWLYGQRDWRTLRGSEETWYMQNTITGVAMVLIGIVWLIVLAVRVLYRV